MSERPLIANASDITATNMAAYLRKSLPRFPNRAGSFVALFAIGVIGRPTYNATCNHVEHGVASTNDTPAAILNNDSVVHPAARPLEHTIHRRSIAAAMKTQAGPEAANGSPGAGLVRAAEASIGNAAKCNRYPSVGRR